MKNEQQISLRERKHVQTKLALANALKERLRDKRLQEISVKELCETIPISEVTFYNYFHEKTDLLMYMMQIWYLEIKWNVRQWEQHKTNLEIIEAWFDFTAQQIAQYSWVMSEIILQMVQKRGCIDLQEISAVEKMLMHPNLEGIETISIPQDPAKDTMLLPYVQRAIEAGELPAATDPILVDTLLDSIFHGVLMSLNETNPTRIRSTYRIMLRMLWHGLRTQDVASLIAE